MRTICQRAAGVPTVVMACVALGGCANAADPTPVRDGTSTVIAATSVQGPVQVEFERTITAIPADSTSPPIGRTRILLRNRTDTAIARVRVRLDTTNGVFVLSQFEFGIRRALGAERTAGPIPARGMIVLDSMPYPFPTYGMRPPHPGAGIDVRTMQVETPDGRRLGLPHAGRHAATLRGTSGIGPSGATVTAFALDAATLWVDQTGSVFVSSGIAGRWAMDSLPMLTVPSQARRCLDQTLFVGRAVVQRDAAALRIAGDRFGSHLFCMPFTAQGSDTLVLVPLP